MDIIKEENKTISSTKNGSVETPKELYRLLNEYVIGQEDAKKILSVQFIITINELTVLKNRME